MGICLVLGGSKPLPGWFVAVIYPQNGDLTKLLKSTRKKVPQSARLSAGGAKAIRAMPKCPLHEFEDGFPNLNLQELASHVGSINYPVGTLPLRC